MTMLRRVRAMIAAVLRRDAVDRAMDDEFALHVDLFTEDLVRRVALFQETAATLVPPRIARLSSIEVVAGVLDSLNEHAISQDPEPAVDALGTDSAMLPFLGGLPHSRAAHGLRDELWAVATNNANNISLGLPQIWVVHRKLVFDQQREQPAVTEENSGMRGSGSPCT